ncbi:hypothetical protein CTheo_6889 [Ceratobasidium theobromae]|uniref:Uncharacterized protein n=1 Tax=Ceratobasidium theobromae TaxID=1582974 RepID=A0A5N5QDZ4_9AGAM|nr:hypothetical protein CTheo_6889 [Ceratobasidium theobromae]
MGASEDLCTTFDIIGVLDHTKRKNIRLNARLIAAEALKGSLSTQVAMLKAEVTRTSNLLEEAQRANKSLLRTIQASHLAVLRRRSSATDNLDRPGRSTFITGISNLLPTSHLNSSRLIITSHYPYVEAIEQLDPGAMDRFEIVESDGVNLEEPLLLDLLSDEPVAGVVARGGYGLSSTENMPVTNGSSPASFVAQPFQFKLFDVPLDAPSCLYRVLDSEKQPRLDNLKSLDHVIRGAFCVNEELGGNVNSPHRTETTSPTTIIILTKIARFVAQVHFSPPPGPSITQTSRYNICLSYKTAQYATMISTPNVDHMSSHAATYFAARVSAPFHRIHPNVLFAASISIIGTLAWSYARSASLVLNYPAGVLREMGVSENLHAAFDIMRALDSAKRKETRLRDQLINAKNLGTILFWSAWCATFWVLRHRKAN